MTPRQELAHLRKHIGQLLIVHYSCQNLNDNNEGYSPRITSIAVLHLGSSTMHSFSIHLIAEIRKIPREKIHEHYDDLEAQMLRDFYTFVKDRADYFWLHWNMSNINYGFEAIDHRYRVLTQEVPPKIDDSKKFNLSTLVSGICGSNYVDHPKLTKLMELNGGRHRDFLDGKEEVEAFANKEYIKLHKSTMSKVYFFQGVFHKLGTSRLKTQRSNWPAKVNAVTEHPVAKILGLVAVLFAVFQLVVYAAERFDEQPKTAEEKPNNSLKADVPDGPRP